MLVRLLASTMLACLVLVATGCHCMHQGMYAGPGMDPCGCGSCGPAMACDTGCGEVYWGEWVSDPPAACDPCDSCGNYTGGVAGPGCYWPFPVLNGLHALWGYRYAPGGHGVAYDGGCETCGSSGVEYMPMETMPMETMPMEMMPMEAAPVLPKPAPEAEQAAAIHRHPVRHATYQQTQPTRKPQRVLR